jgi:hypothetical protein
MTNRSRAVLCASVAVLIVLLAGCASAPKLDADAVKSEAEAFMKDYGTEILSGDRAALPLRYDDHGSYSIFNGRTGFVTAEKRLVHYRDQWKQPAGFEWIKLAYDVVDRNTVIVVGGFAVAPEGARETYSYSALLVRDARSGKFRVRFENEYIVPRPVTPK